MKWISRGWTTGFKRPGSSQPRQRSGIIDTQLVSAWAKVTFSFLLIDLSRTTVLLELDRMTQMAEDDCNLFSA